LIQVQNGLIKNQVGFIEKERYGEFKDKDGNTRKGVLAKFHVLEGFDWLRAAMTDMWNKVSEAIALDEKDWTISDGQFDYAQGLIDTSVFNEDQKQENRSQA